MQSAPGALPLSWLSVTPLRGARWLCFGLVGLGCFGTELNGPLSLSSPRVVTGGGGAG